jgi:copper chaperone CopZ|tara:strand:- start:121 stop:696 length:576 start_codon:yes stop_codon:yes gene_type:complete
MGGGIGDMFMSFSILLQSSNISCEHCINTIKKEIDQIDKIKFISGDADTQSFIVEITNIESIRVLEKSLANADYPLSSFDNISKATHKDKTNWSPKLVIDSQQVDIAIINYSCHCGCEINLEFNRQQPNFQLQDCCCGTFSIIHPDNSYNHLIKQFDQEKLKDTFEYINIENITMPWDQPIQLSVAIPKEQ